MLREAADYLCSCDVDSPALSAQLLAGRVLDMDRLELITAADRQITSEESEAISGLVSRRGRGEPVAYLLGEKEFYGLVLRVSPEVLIPRPETEHLVEETLVRFAPEQPFCFADCGTGSGAIAAAIACERPLAYGLALDLSASALEVAADNFRTCGLEHRVHCIRADYSALPCASNSLDLLVSNPPYVSWEEFHDECGHEVRDFEPRSALMPKAGEHPADAATGLEDVARLLPEAARVLKSGGLLLVEIGMRQGNAARKLLETKPQIWREARILKDLAGLDRVLYGERA